MSKHWEVVRVVGACMFVCVHLGRQERELVTVMRSAEARQSQRESYERRGVEKKIINHFFFSLSFSLTYVSIFPPTSIFITQLCIPSPLRFLAVFCLLSELNKCSLFPRTSVITVCLFLAELLQGSYQLHSRLCHSLTPLRGLKAKVDGFLVGKDKAIL